MPSLLLEVQDWKGFKSRLKSFTKKEKGDAFEGLTHAYLKLDPKYATHLKEVWLLRDVPVEVRDHLKLPNTDEGIDLIARTYEGAYWAIQCKYVDDEDKSLSRRALSTFTDLALNICDNIEYCLVCTSADRYSRKLKMYEGNLGFLSGEVWKGLERSGLRFLHPTT